MPPLHASRFRYVLAAAAVIPLMVSALAKADTGTVARDPGNLYLRAGFSLDWSRKTQFRDKDCSSESPAALYGCGSGPDGAPLQSRGDFGTMTGFELGVGYRASPPLRLEAGRPCLPPELLVRR